MTVMPIRGCLAAVVAAACVLATPAGARSIDPAAEPPRRHVDTAAARSSGKTIVVDRGGSLQAALEKAEPGDVVELKAGVTYTGPFTLPVKPGSDWITVRSEAAGKNRFPPPGRRVRPADASAMARLVSATGPVVIAAPGAHHYRFVGLEIRPGDGESRPRWDPQSLRRLLKGKSPGAAGHVSNRTLVVLGGNEDSAGRLPHHIIFERCYIHAGGQAVRRGIALNSRYSAVLDSHLAGFKTVGADSQAIAGWNGPGPFTIANNYLEAAGENVMFGGADPSIEGLVPSDIEITGNHFAKPLSWRIESEDYAGTPWTVKNLFELKNARRVRVEGNRFEYSWRHGQDGFAVLFTPRNQEGKAPWSVVEDVIFANNLVRHAGGGINILGHDDIHRSRQTRRILISNNLFEDVGAPWGGGRLFQLLRGTAEVVIEHNTAFQSDVVVHGGDNRPHTGFVFINNIAPHNKYGIIGSGTGPGRPTLKRFFPGAIVRKNVLVGGSPRLYPPDNFFPGSPDKVGFVNRAGRDYRLEGSSRYKGEATDGGDVGVDFRVLRAALGPPAGGGNGDRDPEAPAGGSSLASGTAGSGAVGVEEGVAHAP